MTEITRGSGSVWKDLGLPEPSADELAAMAARFANQDEYGPLHVIVSDGNLDDETIEFVIAREDINQAQSDFLKDLRSLSEEDREAVYEMAQHEARRP